MAVGETRNKSARLGICKINIPKVFGEAQNNTGKNPKVMLFCLTRQAPYSWQTSWNLWARTSPWIFLSLQFTHPHKHMYNRYIGTFTSYMYCILLLWNPDSCDQWMYCGHQGSNRIHWIHWPLAGYGWMFEKPLARLNSAVLMPKPENNNLSTKQPWLLEEVYSPPSNISQVHLVVRDGCSTKKLSFLLHDSNNNYASPLSPTHL